MRLIRLRLIYIRPFNAKIFAPASPKVAHPTSVRHFRVFSPKNSLNNSLAQMLYRQISSSLADRGIRF